MTDKRLLRLIKELNHEDASRRRLAAEELASADERALYPLINALRDDNPGVQDASIRSLISIGGDVTAYMMVPLLRDENPFIRNSAIVILRSLGRVSIPFLYSLLKDKDDDIRKFAVDILGDIRDGLSLEKILPLLKDTNPNVRASAAKTIGRLGYDEAVPYLLEALKDEEWVAFSAIEALGEIGGKRAIYALKDTLSMKEEPLRIAAIDAIGKIGTEDAAKTLKSYFKMAKGIEKEVVIRSLLRLGVLPEEDVSKFILKLFEESNDWDDMLLYIRGLAMMRYHRAIASIIDKAGSLDPSMPGAEEIILEVKGRLVEFGCSNLIIDVIDDPRFRFRGKVIAIDVVGELKCQRAVPTLIKLLESNLRDVRRASIRAIGNIDGRGAINTLIEATDDYDSHVRKAAIIALGKIGAKEAFEPITRLLDKEPYEDVVEEAIKSLLSIDRDRFLSMRQEFKGDLSAIVERIIETEAFSGEDQ
ncbi:MAG: HEAT repeat domain-containing protein [Thermodesulfovibrionales bacterium]